jgi:hypothetical protein
MESRNCSISILACKTAFEKDVLLLIDAEESWMQDAADAIVTDMMCKYNQTESYCFQYLTNVSLGSIGLFETIFTNRLKQKDSSYRNEA